MEILILILVAATVLTIIMSGLAMTCRLAQDYCALEALHESLVTRVSKTRLGRMLHRLRINLHDYVNSFSKAAIDAHVGTCKNCDSWMACDHFLSDESRGPEAIRSFCPNMKEFDALRDMARDKPACH